MEFRALTPELMKRLKRGQILNHVTATNADGTPCRAKVNGVPKTWKHQPNRVRVPMKWGWKYCFYLEINGDPQPQTCDQWVLPASDQ